MFRRPIREYFYSATLCQHDPEVITSALITCSLTPFLWNMFLRGEAYWHYSQWKVVMDNTFKLSTCDYKISWRHPILLSIFGFHLPLREVTGNTQFHSQLIYPLSFCHSYKIQEIIILGGAVSIVYWDILNGNIVFTGTFQIQIYLDRVYQEVW